MKSYHEYWSFATVRGVLALLAAAVVVALPRAIADLFSIPVLLAFSISAFALWAVFDSALTVLLANLFPTRAAGRTTLIPQALAVFTLAAVLFLTGYRVLPAQTLIWAVAALAAVSALAEFRLAETTHKTYYCLSCYSTAITFAVAALAFPFAAFLTPAQTTLALGAFLGLIGSSEIALGTRMLFLGYRHEHPLAPSTTLDWRTAMEPANLPAPANHAPATHAPANQPAPATFAAILQTATPALTCDTCPATAVCLDDSVSTQLHNILTSEQPAIVRSLRASTLITQHQLAPH